MDESLKKSEVRDWRIGLSCKPKYRTHPLYYEGPGRIIDTCHRATETVDMRFWARIGPFSTMLTINR